MGCWPDRIAAVRHPEKVGCWPDRIAVVRHPDKMGCRPDRIADMRHPDKSRTLAGQNSECETSGWNW